MKENLLHIAEVVDAWRIVPRIFLAWWSFFAMQVGTKTLNWFVAEPANSRGFEEAAVVVGVFTAVLGFVKFVFDRYSSSGRDWVANPVIAQQKDDPPAQ